MTNLDVRSLGQFVAAWHDIGLSKDLATAIAAESADYVEVTETLSADLAFDDQPSDFRHSQAGRRGWRGKS